MIIVANVNGQNLDVRQPTIADNTANYITARFRFSSAWDGLRKFVHFLHGENAYIVELDENDELTESAHINLAEGEWTIFVHGSVMDGETLVQRITTTTATVNVVQSGIISCEPFPEMASSVGEITLAKAEAAADRAEDAASRAESVEVDLQTKVSKTGDSMSGALTMVGQTEDAAKIKSTRLAGFAIHNIAGGAIRLVPNIDDTEANGYDFTSSGIFGDGKNLGSAIRKFATGFFNKLKSYSTPTAAEDVTNKEYTDAEFCHSLNLSVSEGDYVLTAKLVAKNGDVIDTKSVDLPIESMVVGAEYDAATKSIVLTLQSGETLSVPIGDLLSGLATEEQLDTKVDKHGEDEIVIFSGNNDTGISYDGMRIYDYDSLSETRYTHGGIVFGGDIPATITNVASPSDDLDVANKVYVDSYGSMRSIVIEYATSVSLQMKSGIVYRCENPVNAMSLTFQAAPVGKDSAWSIMFSVGALTEINLPSNTHWSIAEPVFEQGKTYRIEFTAIVGGYAATWAKLS